MRRLFEPGTAALVRNPVGHKECSTPWFSGMRLEVDGVRPNAKNLYIPLMITQTVQAVPVWAI